MNVDNLVERRACGRVNSAKFNTMIRIAPFLCKDRGRNEERGKFPAPRDSDHEIVGRKAQILLPTRALKRKSFAEKRMGGKKARETFA
jgi:hypothetical protein